MSEKFLNGGSASACVEILIFILGGAAYGLLETLFRGYTHWTMVLTGGACVLTIYVLSDRLLSMNLISAAMGGALIITAYEFFVGIIVNLRLEWNVWDYSSIPGNVLGQICPMFTLAWFILCFVFLGCVKIFS